MTTTVTAFAGLAVPDLSTASVVLLAGGRSSERDVSLWTARGVADALQGRIDTPHRARLPRRVRVVELEADGQWSCANRRDTPTNMLRELDDVDVFFSCLHGGEGEDGTLQGFLTTLGARFTGSGVRASALCMDKQATRSLAQSLDITVAAGVCFSRLEWREEREMGLARCERLSREGWVIKPRCGGSSVATFVTREKAEIATSIEAVLATGDDVLVEARIPGVELSCGVLGNRNSDCVALPPIEIAPRDGKFFDYEQKYSTDGAREICPPANVSATSIARVQDAARRFHARAGCDGYSRTDFIVPVAESGEGEPVMLEINTLPGLTARSLLPQEAAAIGIDYTALCLMILELGRSCDRGARG